MSFFKSLVFRELEGFAGWVLKKLKKRGKERKKEEKRGKERKRRRAKDERASF